MSHAACLRVLQHMRCIQLVDAMMTRMAAHLCECAFWYVCVQDNGFTGTIPVGQENLALHVFRGRNNKFSGTIPGDFWELPMLITVDISNNRSVGGIKFRVLDQRCRFFICIAGDPHWLATHTTADETRPPGAHGKTSHQGKMLHNPISGSSRALHETSRPKIQGLLSCSITGNLSDTIGMTSRLSGWLPDKCLLRPESALFSSLGGALPMLT